MSDPGFGPPIDALDSVCKSYKDCNRCAIETFGDTCTGEQTKYSYGFRVSQLTENIDQSIHRIHYYHTGRQYYVPRPSEQLRTRIVRMRRHVRHKTHSKYKLISRIIFQYLFICYNICFNICFNICLKLFEKDKYHTFYSSQEGHRAWDARENCPRGGGAQRSAYQPKCCTNRIVLFPVNYPNKYHTSVRIRTYRVVRIRTNRVFEFQIHRKMQKIVIVRLRLFYIIRQFVFVVQMVKLLCPIVVNKLLFNYLYYIC